MSSVDSIETFRHRFEMNHGQALAKLQSAGGFAPDAELIRDVHERLFLGIFHSAGGFRDNSRPAVAQEGHELCASREIEDRLRKIAEPVKFLTLEENSASQVKKISNYHAEFMELEPFSELPNSNFINRAVALTILESQLEHCFNAKSIKRDIDAEKLREAVHYHTELASPVRLEQLIRDMAGQKSKGISLDAHGPELERDR